MLISSLWYKNAKLNGFVVWVPYELHSWSENAKSNGFTVWAHYEFTN